MKRMILLSFMVTTFAACKKSELPIVQQQQKSEQQLAKIEFAQTLAKAVAKEPLLRSFIKNEALKQFDKDYDVLFNLIKDQKMEDGESVYEKITKYASSKENFEMNLNKMPLLTIYVPVLPEFSAENWKPESQIPMIAVEPDKKQKDVEIYDGDGNKIELEFKYIPAFPVIVIKENERVTIQNTGSNNLNSNRQFIKGSDMPVAFAKKDGLTYSFISNDFNGTIQSRVTTASGIDAVNIEAFNSGDEWQRDYVYYGITPTNTNGIFTNRFSEFIRSFKFINGNDYYLVSDQTGDPTLRNPFIYFDDVPPLPSYKWTEGNYEFRISILINAKNGVGQELRKIFTAQGQDLFEPVYQIKKNFLYWTYTVVGVTSKEFYPTNLELIPWDLEQYGSAWKFIVSEYDPTEELTRSVTNSSTFGANFGVDINTGQKTKIGPKFGISATTTSSTTYTYKTTTGSDDLGEGILDFRSPIITNYASGNYATYEVTTGVVSLSVEPKRIY